MTQNISEEFRRKLKEFLLEHGCDEKPELREFLTRSENRLSEPTQRALLLIVDRNLLMQIASLPYDYPYDEALPTWIADVVKADRDITPQAASEAIDCLAATLGYNVRGSLTTLIQNDPDTALDSNAVRTLLHSECPDRLFLVSLLVRAIDSGIVAEITRVDDPAKLAALRSTWIEQLQDSCLNNDLSEWILSSWFIALGRIEPAERHGPRKSKKRGFTGGLIATLLAIYFVRQLFWFLWAVDEQSRWREGFNSLPLCVTYASIVGGAIAYVLMRFALRMSPLRRIAPEPSSRFVCGVVALSSLVSALAAAMLVIVESQLPPAYNSIVATCFGLPLGLIGYYLYGRKTALHLLYAILGTYGVFYLHKWTFFEDDPESFGHFTCVMPGGDAFFVLISALCGAATPAYCMYRAYAQWKGAPSNRFVELSSLIMNPLPLVAVDRAGRRSVTTEQDSFDIRAAEIPDIRLQGHMARVTAIAFSPAGDLFASASNDATTRVWSYDEQTDLATLYKHSKSVTAVAWSECGTLLATGGNDGCITIWDSASWKMISHLKLGLESVASVTFDNLDRNVLFVCSRSGDVCSIGLVSNTITGKAQFEVGGSCSLLQVESKRLLVVSGKSNMVTASLSDLAQVAKAEYLHDKDEGETSVVGQLHFDRERGEALIQVDSTIHCWDLQSPTTRKLAHERVPDAFTVSPDEAKVHILTDDGSLLSLHRENDELIHGHEIAANLSSTPIVNQEGWFEQFFGGKFEEYFETEFEQTIFAPTCRGVVLRTIVILLAMASGYGLFGLAGMAPGGSLGILHCALTYNDTGQSEISQFALDITRAWRSGITSGWYVFGTLGAVAALTSSVVSFQSRWHAEMVRIQAELGMLWALRWLILPATFLAYLASSGWPSPIPRFLFIEAFWVTTIALCGWGLGVAKSACVAITQVNFWPIFIESSERFEERFGELRFGAIHIFILAGIGLPVIGCGLGFQLLTALPTSMFESLPMVLFGNEGTRSGQGTYPNTFANTPGNPVLVDTMRQDFHERPDWAKEEYVGREFLIEGNMISRFPNFRLSDSVDGAPLVHCDFGFQDFELIKKNEFLDAPLDKLGKNVALQNGQRVLVGGICLGLNEQGLITFERCRINRSMFDPTMFDQYRNDSR